MVSVEYNTGSSFNLFILCVGSLRDLMTADAVSSSSCLTPDSVHHVPL